MKKFLSLLLLASPLSIFAAEPQVGTGETDGYRLVWQDLFDSGSINLDRWDIEVNGDGGGNNELQYYTDFEKNVHVGDDGQGNGCLILTARREDYKGKKFTSGRVTSQNRTTFTHGKIEAAIKMPKTANGLWPAFWMMGNDIGQVGWPKCGETDIVEMGNVNGINRGTSERYFNGACHWGTAWNRTGDYAKDCTLEYSLQDGQFHLFTCIWDENYISMYVDKDKYPNREPYYKIDITKVDWNEDMTAGNYFHKPNFILFNLAVGGNFPSIWDANGITALNDANGQEASMYINYVKIYQKGKSNETLYSRVPGDEQNSTDVAITKIENGPVEVFNLGGVRVAYVDSASDLNSILDKGFYIVKSANKTEKIMIN